MKIVLSQEKSRFGTSSLEELQTGMPQKVVIVRTPEGEEVAHIFPVHIQHIQIARDLLRQEGTKLLSAGRVDTGPCGRGGDPAIECNDSNTCRDDREIGYDGPKSAQELSRLTADLATGIKSLLASHL